MSVGATTDAVRAQRSADLREVQMAQIRTHLARSDDSTRGRVALVLVHEVLRRRTRDAAAELAHIDIAPRRFDPARWPESSAERLEVYESLVGRVRARIRSVVPPASRIAVVTRGDERLLDVSGLGAVHFPQDLDGRYAGHYPADGVTAVSQVQDLIAARTDYLVLPATAFWWLDHYPELARFLGPLAVHADEDCTVYDLRRAREPRGAAT